MPDPNCGSAGEGIADVPEGEIGGSRDPMAGGPSGAAGGTPDIPDTTGRPHTPGGIFGGVFTRGGPVADDAAWLRAMLAAEAALARALEAAGLAPAGAGASVTDAASRIGDFDLAELSQSSALTGNPVPGLARTLTRLVADPAAKTAVHKGATSQDIMDTAAMLLARDAIDAVTDSLSAATAAAARLAAAHAGTLMIGRTLLQQAVPVTFGVVAAGWLAGLDGALDGLASVRETRLAVQFGGAAGTLASLGPSGAPVKSLMAAELGLLDPPLPWHTERLRIIDVAVAMARVTAALSKIARDVTLLAQTEIAEVTEGAEPTEPNGSSGPRRGGSSAMPNKNNPVAAIAILGCARQAGGLVATLIASAEQEHQRAAGAWHAEWQPFSHLLQLAVSAAAWARDLLANLTVDAGRMAANLAATGGLPMAERVTALLRDSLGAPQAHDLVAAAAARAVSDGVPLREALLAAPDVADQLAAAGISAAEIDQALDPAGYLGAAEPFIAAALAAHDASQITARSMTANHSAES
jgi:3-carboxy-cis,cis-muconate cycloisomerase